MSLFLGHVVHHRGMCVCLHRRRVPWARVTHHVVVDGERSIYVAGSTAGGEVMGDALLRKYDPAGEELWTRQFGSSQHDSGNGVAVDGEGNVYVAGRTQGAMPGQAYSGMQDAFVMQLTQ